jgi:hypothetical protein
VNPAVVVAEAPSRHASDAWLVSNFRLSIGTLRTAAVDTVEALCVQQPPPADEPGAALPALQLPDLVFTLPERDADEFAAWFDELVAAGGDGASAERDGTLAFLAPDQSPLFTLSLAHLGIFRMRRAAGTGIARMRVELYCEQLALTRA